MQVIESERVSQIYEGGSGQYILLVNAFGFCIETELFQLHSFLMAFQNLLILLIRGGEVSGLNR